MFSFLVKKCISNAEQYEKSEVRTAYGNLASLVGIFLSIVLCALKFLAGTIANSVSITADAINNLSDAGSSLIALVSFKLSSKPADEDHPFGHARYECIASMIVATLILFLGIELISSSVDKILHPEIVVFSWLSFAILTLSIAVKLYMFLYNRKYGRLIHSSVMQATATDSISDAIATAAVLISMVISPLIHFNLDGYVGVVVACFILLAGYGIIKEALNEILGQAPSKELVHEIAKRIEGTSGVLGMHDLIVHDYGANRLFASVHVEVDYREDVFKSHDMIDNLEREFKQDMNIEMVIHMDPVVANNPKLNELKEYMNLGVKEIDKECSLHDFRMVPGETHTNLIFDVVVPFHVKMSNVEIQKRLEEYIKKKDHMYFLVITYDRLYV